jgi:hypothetical protein
MFTLILTNEENIYIFLLLAQTEEIHYKDEPVQGERTSQGKHSTLAN